jgi:hypothetical protein
MLEGRIESDYVRAFKGDEVCLFNRHAVPIATAFFRTSPTGMFYKHLTHRPMDDHLPKPVRMEFLFESLRKWVPAKRAADMLAGPESP